MFIIHILLLIYKMAKEMNVTCDFVEKQLVCELPKQMMDVLLKIRTKTGEYTFLRRCLYTYFEILQVIKAFQIIKKESG